MKRYARIRQIRRETYSDRSSLKRLLVIVGLTILLLTLGCTASPSTRIEFRENNTAGSEVIAPGRIVMVLSAAPTQTLADGSIRDTGYFLNEFYVPYQQLVDEGYEVVIATPGGQLPALDPESLDEGYWENNPGDLDNALNFIKTNPQMQAPKSLEEIADEQMDYQAIVVPGGQGVMVDLLNNTVLHGLLLEFGRNDRPVGLICHAPAILTRLEAADNPFTGRLVASVSDIEEWFIETFIMGAEAQDRLIGRQLSNAGYQVVTAFPGRPHAVRDCNLVTNQNPYSGEPFNELFTQALKDWRSGGRCVSVE
jgi:putative intracellular protease/amidase